ncbi:trypsin-1-like [Arctopsyche grandis]|uniref:trypsin-1-like n=1 Tax=Arctopsyche grandis TaxID=121162 RepID=UPI00406D8E35
MGWTTHNFVAAILVLSLFTHINSQDPGDYCTLDDDSLGGCTPLLQCASFLTNLRTKRINPKLCGKFNGKTYVCCAGKQPKTSTVATCAYPSEAIIVNRTNQKSWNKCIDLADSVFPCISVGGGTQIRRSTCKHTAAELILGGTEAKPNEFPHMALLGFDNTEFNKIDWDCGGTLISEQWVMTAAHCMFNKITKLNVKYVRLGGEDVNVEPSPEFLFNVIERVKHPNYTIAKIYNDIALLKLDRPIVYSYKIRPACLHVGNEVIKNKAIATGWGTMEDLQTKSNKLLKVTLDKFSIEECRRKFSEGRKSPQGIVDESQICYGSHTEVKDACQGDSGGPLQIYNNGVHCTYNVIGITSMGKQCGLIGVPGVYTRVSYYVPWIESVVWPN